MDTITLAILIAVVVVVLFVAVVLIQRSRRKGGLKVTRGNDSTGPGGR